MARPRALSGADAPKEPHAVSLKGTPQTTHSQRDMLIVD
jgi:hypothetical protein